MGATFGTGNMGVSALTAGSIESILHKWPNAQNILLDYERTPVHFRYASTDKLVALELLNLRFSKKLYNNNVAILILLAFIMRLTPSRLQRILSLHNTWLEEIYNSDLAVSISGGDSFSDIYGLRRFLYVSLPQILVLITGIKLVLLPQTLGPFNGRIAQTLARSILKRAALVYSRDYAGLKEMENFLGRDFDPLKFRFSYDVGFAVNPTLPENMDLDGLTKTIRSSPVVGINVSGLLWMGGYTQSNQFNLQVDYRQLVVKLIHDLINEKNATVLLVPHVFGEAENSESDQTVCEMLYRELKLQYGNRLYLARGKYDQSEIKYIIGLCDFFIGSRMHACIAALSQCIPSVPVAYSRKFIGVMETIGVESYVADPRSMDGDEILKMVDKAWAERDMIRRRLQAKIPEVRSHVLGLFKQIAQALQLED